ncbi:MAG: MOSC domain-containing protein [Desulfovibrionales bacterium]
MCRVVEVYVSPRRGEPKRSVAEIELMERLVAKDDVRLDSERQVSLLSMDTLSTASSKCPSLEPGSLSEIITIADLDLEELPEGTRLWVGDKAVLEITGSDSDQDFPCTRHRHTVFHAGSKEVFARVVSGGRVRKGDHVIILSVGKKKDF